ncbi:MAG: YqzE family protein [Bacillaceae bacterium]|nr:YqzE family protein [Bacillaceae bacterium]
MSSHDLVKYLTEEFVKYVETPRKQRKERKVRENWSSRWFGMIPMSIMMAIRRKDRKL